MELSGIDRGEIDSHGRDLSKKMPAGAGIEGNGN
jgi:hypothetical protein